MEESCVEVEPNPCSVMAAVAVVDIEADDVEPLMSSLELCIR